MEKIKASDIAKLPIKDPTHVVEVINWRRQYEAVNRAEQKRRSDYMQRYNARNKEL